MPQRKHIGEPADSHQRSMHKSAYCETLNAQDKTTQPMQTTMDIHENIKKYLDSQQGAKRLDLETLHLRILQIMPNSQTWFLDGKDENGQVLTNPNIGYGHQTLHYADGKTKDFYQVGISANTTGISVYIIGIKDKKYLPETYGKTIGKASVTGYCIKFRALKDVHLEILETAILDGVKQTRE